MNAGSLSALACNLRSILILVLSGARVITGSAQQFLYDQQSANETGIGEVGFPFATNPPVGQSFIPSLSGIQFVSLQFGDANWGNGVGASVYVNLRSNSISGPILAATDIVLMPDGMGTGTNHGFTNFFFPSFVPLV